MEPTQLVHPPDAVSSSVQHYRDVVIAFLTQHAQGKYAYGEIERELILDRERDHYLVLDVGWQGEYTRVYGPSIHLDIINEKVWLQCNHTETDVPAELMQRGVAREDIVLGKHPPYKRPYTGYAVE
ncbi:MAG: XisI protein (plasmid) [Leptolyngbya sp. BL-A-14]